MREHKIFHFFLHFFFFIRLLPLKTFTWFFGVYLVGKSFDNIVAVAFGVVVDVVVVAAYATFTWRGFSKLLLLKKVGLTLLF